MSVSWFGSEEYHQLYEKSMKEGHAVPYLIELWSFYDKARHSLSV